jgi:hypothetical protein
MLSTALGRGATSFSVIVAFCLFAGSSVAAPNLIVNGDFSITDKKKQGFSTQYAPAVAPARLGTEGTYDIVSNATQLKNDNKFFVYPNGYAQFMAVNGATATLGNKDNASFYTVWTESIPLQANTTYSFAGWVSSLVAESPAVLWFGVNGGTLGTLTAPATTDAWRQFSFSYSTAKAGTFTFQIADENLTKVGNDFGLAMLSLTATGKVAPVPMPEPSTWSLLLVGFAGLGYAGYRRRRACGRYGQASGLPTPPQSGLHFSGIVIARSPQGDVAIQRTTAALQLWIAASP